MVKTISAFINVLLWVRVPSLHHILNINAGVGLQNL